MTIKVREPGEAFRRQVSEFIPVKKRRPWRDEESVEAVPEEPAGSLAREVQGASSKEDSAVVEVCDTSISSRERSALDEVSTLGKEEQLNGAFPSIGNTLGISSTEAENALVEGAHRAVSSKEKFALVEMAEEPENSVSTSHSTIEIITSVEEAGPFSSTQANSSLVEDLKDNASSSAKIASDESAFSTALTLEKNSLDEAFRSNEVLVNKILVADREITQAEPRTIVKTSLDEALLKSHSGPSSNEKSALVGQETAEVLSKVKTSLDEDTVRQSSTEEKFALVGKGPAESSKAKTSLDESAIGESSSKEKSALVEVEGVNVSSRVKTSLDEDRVGVPSTNEKAALVEAGVAEVSSTVKNSADEDRVGDSSTKEKSALVGRAMVRVSSKAKTSLDEDKLGVSSTEEISALVEEGVVKDSSMVKNSTDEDRVGDSSTKEKSALVQNDKDRDKRSYPRHIRQPFRSISIKSPVAQNDLREALPGTRKTRASFVFDLAVRQIDHPTAALLYCYLWHQAEEIGSAQLKITFGEMSEALKVSKRTLQEATKRLTELGLFENVNQGRTTVPVVKLHFDLTSFPS